MNSHVGAGDKPEKLHRFPAQKEAPLSGTLNPYHDGRIRTAVPSKLKGKTIGNQGNFSVLQMQVQKPEMTARDLAAKRTSERTAAAAKLASSQGYRHPRRLRLQPATTSLASVPVAIPLAQTLSPPRSQLSYVVPPAPRPNSLPHITPSPAYQEQPLGKQAVATTDITLDIDSHQVSDPCAESNGLHPISPEYSRGQFVVVTAREGSVEQADATVTDQDPMQDINVEVTDEPFMTVDSQEIETEHTSGVTKVTGEVNQEQTREITVDSRWADASQTTELESMPQPLSPDVVKSEQARILTLFRYTQPRFIVDQLVEALVHFGTIPDGPPTDTTLFTKSTSNNGPGNLFVSWLSEIFPAIPLESHKMKKPPTGRPRGRPKGSIASYSRQTTAVHSTSTAFVPRTYGTTSTQIRLMGDGTSKSQQAVEGVQGPDVILSPVPAAQSPTATIVPASRGQEDVSLQPIADVSSRTVAIPRMRSIFPSMAPIAEASAPNSTPVQRKKSTGRPRGRPPGSKNKSKSISKTQSDKAGQQDSRPGRSNYLGPQSEALWPLQPNSGSPDTVESRMARPDALDSLGSIKEKRRMIDPNSQRTLQQAPREGPTTILPQASDPTAPPASSSQQAKRRRLSQETFRRDPVSSVASISRSRALSDVFESNSSMGFQSAQSRPSQYTSRHQNQNWYIEHPYQGQQPQSQLHPPLQHQFHPQQLSRNTGSGT
ncbi:unnamed protein product [Fusarium venenatum]|uniref:Uncharacterized protein n=1 Tax=Fusarium venenatum TaxID=56646 RepID=A0A2L2TP09_9HYPO|nr:uncharacterized protein FVRRES_01628 [Fusarium venenatum]KAH7005215.1 hypothetical protein EDB82DRAFT_72972 [Fusarium venenatum]CEI65116.1 unnamed protein product [Fusarium venenatum]